MAGHLSMIKGGLFVVVTAWLLYVERHRSEVSLAGETAALAASEARQRAMIEALPDLVFVLDRDGRVTDYWAPRADLLYASPDAFAGKHLSEVLPEEFANLWLAKAQEAIRTGELVECRYTMDIPAGRRQFEARVVPCGGGSLAVVRDVTLQHELLEELGRTAKTEALGRMAGDIAHEFNNLLSAVLGYAEFLRDGLDPDDQVRRDDAEQILCAARRGAELTSQLLAFSRRQAVHASTFDVVAMVDALRPVLRRLVPASADLQFDLAPRGELAAHADAGQVHTRSSHSGCATRWDEALVSAWPPSRRLPRRAAAGWTCGGRLGVATSSVCGCRSARSRPQRRRRRPARAWLAARAMARCCWWPTTSVPSACWRSACWSKRATVSARRRAASRRWPWSRAKAYAPTAC
ncbi:MAG: PAS domain-containing protein [Armatimonadetes bacterium]|nr:PAS domain-containing protein [Armatimonadota bacterium]